MGQRSAAESASRRSGAHAALQRILAANQRRLYRFAEA
jgi:hypothetical protein